MIKKIIKISLYTLFPHILAFILAGIFVNLVKDTSQILEVSKMTSLTASGMLLITPISFLLSYIIFVRKKLPKFKMNKGEIIDVVKIMALGTLVNIIGQFLLFREITERQTVLNMIEPTGVLVAIFITGIFVPFCEELYFRKGLDEMIENKKIFYLVNISYFTFLHFDSKIKLISNLPILTFIFGFACLLTYYYKKNDNIYVPIIAHSLMNSVGIVAMFLGG